MSGLVSEPSHCSSQQELSTTVWQYARGLDANSTEAEEQPQGFVHITQTSFYDSVGNRGGTAPSLGHL